MVTGGSRQRRAGEERRAGEGRGRGAVRGWIKCLLERRSIWWEYTREHKEHRCSNS